MDNAKGRCIFCKGPGDHRHGSYRLVSGERVARMSCRKCSAENARKWRKGNPKRMYEIVRRSTVKHWNKTLARQRVHYALRTGKITRPEKCGCGSSVRVEAHHEDYSRPLDVVWMCRSCHADHHRTVDKSVAES